MRKVTIALFLLLFASSALPAHASSLVTVNASGDVIVNVLASEDQIALGTPEKTDLSIKKVSNGAATDKSLLLKKENEKILLAVGENKEMDVTNWADDVLEIEERGNVKKVNVSIKEGKFAITEAGINALTEYPININPKENELSLVTGSGAIFLSVLPAEAAETALRSKYVSNVNKSLEITEKDLGVLAYSVTGQRAINILNVIKFDVPVTAYVSTTTGEIVSVDQPKWLSAVGFLFS